VSFHAILRIPALPVTGDLPLECVKVSPLHCLAGSTLRFEVEARVAQLLLQTERMD
jgi:hypothetical protein